jgi:hypothetical protein
VLCIAGYALAYVVGELDEGVAIIDSSLTLNPNLNWAWTISGWLRIWLGEPKVAIDHLARSMRLRPLDVRIDEVHTAQAHAHFFLGQYDEAWPVGKSIVGLRFRLAHGHREPRDGWAN